MIRTDIHIPLRDGVRLAATLYRPAGDRPAPCLVNYLPYHKDGRGGLWYDAIHQFFASRGHASLVVDFRGLGCSEGTNNVPFDAQEGRDGHDVVEWAAAQPWCDGNLGMWGSSYGGITALKTAAERPPHLRAIVPLNATTDNFLDFLLLGGCRAGFWPNGDWGPRMIAYNLAPPLAADPDGRLGQLWARRWEEPRPWCLDWYDRAGEADRWAARAIPVERIEAATLAVCGWKDFYVQGTLDYFRRLTAPKKLVMGPWKHAFPDLSLVEPIDFLEQMVRWWDRWLRGADNGADRGPAIALFVQGSGVWRHEDDWPPARNEGRRLYPAPDFSLGVQPPAVSCRGPRYQHDPTVGLDSIGFDPWTTAVLDQGNHNGDDARSLCFTTAPLAEDWEVTGEPGVLLPVWASVAGLNYVVKLCDVAPDGTSRLVTMGWRPDPATTAETVRQVEVPLRATSHIFRRGHRIRLGLALADFPRLWPTPQAGAIELVHDPAQPPRLDLPRTPVQAPPLPPPAFERPAARPVSAFEREASQSWVVRRELVSQSAALESRSSGRYDLRDGGSVVYAHAYTATVVPASVNQSEIRCESSVEVERAGETVRVIAQSQFTPEGVSIRVQLVRNGQSAQERRWSAP